MKNLIKNIKELFSKQNIFVVILYAIFSMFSTSIWCMEEASLKKEQAKNIFFAIKEKDLEAVKNIIELSPEKINNKATKEDCRICRNEAFLYITPISLACYFGKVDIVKYLVEKMDNLKIDFNVPLISGKYKGGTPLAIASSGGWVDIVRYLVEKGANLNDPLDFGEEKGWTPLAISCGENKIEVVKYLIEKDKKYFNKPIATRDGFNGYTPLAIACNNGNVQVVKYIVEEMEKLKIDFNAPLTSGKNVGWTLLVIACSSGAIEVVKYLIEKDKKHINKQIVAKGGFNGYTPLVIACKNSKVEVVKYLVEEMEKLKIDFNAPLKSGNNVGWTPLAMACDEGRVEVVKYLVGKMEKLKIDFNAPFKFGGNFGWTPLMGACYKGHFEVVEYLVGRKQEDINKLIRTECSLDGYTPLAIACVVGNFNIVKYLVEKLKILNKDFINAPLTVGPNAGWTPISIACNKGFVEIFKYLVEELYGLGLDFNAPLPFGKEKGLTPLFIATGNGNSEIFKIIKEAYKKKDANKEVCSKNIVHEESVLDEKSLSSSKSIMKNSALVRKFILKNCKDNKKDLIDRIFNVLENNIHRIGLFVNDIKDDEGNTPLSLACRNSNWALVQELLKYSNADTINTFNNEKKSCLYYACEKIASNEIIEKLATSETVSPSNDNPELHPILIALKLYNANKDNSNGEILSNIIHSLIARNENLDCLFNERMTLDPLKAANPIKSLILLAREFDNVKKEGFLKFLISIEEKKGFEKILSTLISRFIYRSFYEVKSMIKESIFKTDLIAFLNEMKKAKELGSKSELLKKIATKNGYSLIKEFNESKRLKLDFSVMCDDNCAFCFEKPRSWDAELCMLKCGHIFHAKCIKGWIETPENKNCPICRKKIETI